MLFLMIMTLKFYFLATNTSPGHPEKGWKPTQEEQEVLEKYSFSYKKEYLILKNKKPYFCEKCNNFKPLMTHHCRECNKCILRHDHHCKIKYIK